MNEDLKKELDKVTADVEKEMIKLLPDDAVEERHLFESMKYTALAKAKRIRAFLILESAKLFNVPRNQAIAVACAIEFMHAYSLIHDDLPSMDDAQMRRGKISNHLKFDEATAILAGDALQPLAFEILSNPKFIPDANVRCDLIYNFAHAVGALGMVGGQALDMLEEKRDLSFRTMMRMNGLKTGEMFIFSCMSGAILGDAKNAEKKALYKYSIKFGRVFQITDDILDKIGDEKIVGKTLRNDTQKNTFVKVYGVDAAISECKKLIDEACQELKVFKQDTFYLEEIAKFLLNRTH